MQAGFRCDDGQKIHVGENFLANYDVTLLDIAEARIGDDCMIGPKTLGCGAGHSGGWSGTF